jgi:hypothetical protein
MTAWIFFLFTGLSLAAGAVAFLPFPKIDKGSPSSEKSNQNAAKIHHPKILIIGAALALIPILAKMTFSMFPLLEARIMPIDIYASIQREFWLSAIRFLLAAKTGHGNISRKSGPELLLSANETNTT